MKRSIYSTVIFTAFISLAGISMAADGGTLYLGKCSACHGAGGGGSAMGPAINGNELIISGGDEQIAEVILNGRSGADKIYKEIPIGMPAVKLEDHEVRSLIRHLKLLASEKK